MKQTTNLNIIFICDENYAFATLMSIRSLKAHRNKKYNHHVYIVTKDLSRQSADTLEAESEQGSFQIVICINHMEFSDILSEHPYVSKAALIKFALPSIFNHCDKALYVDGDILFREGFEDIFQADIDCVYAAVVKDMPTYFAGKHLQELGLEQYFNSGVMYLNLEKMRCDGIEQKLLDYKRREKEKPMFMDQDAFNVIFDERVIFVHPRFNFIYDICRHYTTEKIADFYCISEDEAEKLNLEAAIMHMAGGIKPWNTLESEQLEEWLDYIQYVKEVIRWGQNTYGKNIIGLKVELNNVLVKIDRVQSELQQIQTELKNKNESLQMMQEKIASLENSYNNSFNIQQEQILDIKSRMEVKEQDDERKQALYENIERRVSSLENMILLRIYRKIRRCWKKV